MHHLLSVCSRGMETFVRKKGGKKGAECDVGVKVMFVLYLKKAVGFGLGGVINARKWGHSFGCGIIHGVVVTIVPVTKFSWSLGFDSVDVRDEGVELG